MSVTTAHRLRLLAAIALVIPLGYVLRVTPTLPEWSRNFLGNIAYCLLWSLMVAVIVPKLPALRLAIIGSGLVVLIEFSQLIEFDWLNDLRSHQLGRLILGSGFTWIDQLEYLVAAPINSVILQSVLPRQPHELECNLAK